MATYTHTITNMDSNAGVNTLQVHLIASSIATLLQLTDTEPHLSSITVATSNVS